MGDYRALGWGFGALVPPFRASHKPPDQWKIPISPRPTTPAAWRSCPTCTAMPGPRLAAAQCAWRARRVGSWAAEALAAAASGRLTLIDLDHVAESNINRQIHASDATLGQAKGGGPCASDRRLQPGLRGGSGG